MASASAEQPDGPALIAQRDSQMAANVSVFFKERGGLVAVRGEGCFLVDEQGQRHLDTCNNVACVGHSHPAVVQAGQQALAQVQTNQRFLHPTQQRYVAKLLATFPPELNTVYLCNSGSEANDLALRIARAHSRFTAKHPQDVIVLDRAYHGNTTATMELSPYKWNQQPTANTSMGGESAQILDEEGQDITATTGCGMEQPAHVHVVSMPDVYRGKHALPSDYTPDQLEVAARLYAQEVADIVQECPGGKEQRLEGARFTTGRGGCGTFIAESAMGCGGQIVLPPTYLARCYELVRAGGGVCIADEVQTGFGRCGEHFWMFEVHKVVPDIVTLGKPMGNGYPLSAVVCRRSMADSFAATGIEYFNTFGGNSVACAIGEAVLDTISAENLQQKALLTGQYLTAQLKALQTNHSCLGDVRGCGLFQGIEFVDGESGEPDESAAQGVVDFLQSIRIISSRDANVLKIKPPLVFGPAEVDVLVSGIEKAILVG